MAAKKKSTTKSGAKKRDVKKDATGAPAKKSAAKKVAAKKPAAPKTTATKVAAPKPVVKKRAAKAASPKAPTSNATKRPAPRRADYGAAVDGFFAKKTGPIGEILTELRTLIESVVPEAAPSLKWGMPFYTLGGEIVCGLGAHKAHVNLILSGPENIFVDPKGLLEGDGKTGRRLRVTAARDIPKKEAESWIVAAARNARGKA
jgi:hypothetical protein